MKKSTKLFGVVAAIAALASCNKEIIPAVEEIPEGMVKVTFTASQGTKTSMQSGGDIYWSAEDAIGVEYVVDGAPMVYEFEIVEPQDGIYNDKAAFEALIPANAVAPSDVQMAYYPYIDEHKSSYSATVLATQVYAGSTFATNTLPMSARVDGTNLQFTASAAVVKVPGVAADSNEEVKLSYGAHTITMISAPTTASDLIFVVDALGQSSFTVNGVVYNTGVKDGELKKIVAGKRYELHKVAPAAAPAATSVTSTQDSSVDSDDESVAEIKNAIEQNTSVEGVTLKTEENKGVNAVLAAAAPEGSDLATALASATEVSIHVDVKVTPSDYVAPTTGTQGSIAFDLKPIATVTAGGVSATTPVTNEMLDTTLPIVVNIYTGFEPSQIVHKDDNGELIETISGAAIQYNTTTGVATIQISHFSSLEVYEKEVPAGVAKIGNKIFATLEKAYEAAVNGDTIELLADVTLSAPLVVAKTLTLNLGTYNITAAAGKNAIQLGDATGAVGCNLTIDADAANPGSISSSSYSIYSASTTKDRQNNAERTLTIKNGVFGKIKLYDKLATSNAKFVYDPNASCVINGGVFNGSFYSYRVDLTFNGGTFNNTSITLYQLDGTLTAKLNGGRFKAVLKTDSGNSSLVYGGEAPVYNGSAKTTDYYFVDAEGYYALTKGNLPADFEVIGDGYRYMDAAMAFNACDKVTLNKNTNISIAKSVAKGSAGYWIFPATYKTFTIDATAEGAVYNGTVTLGNEYSKFVISTKTESANLATVNGTNVYSSTVTDNSGVTVRTYGANVSAITEANSVAEANGLYFKSLYDAFCYVDGTAGKTVKLTKDNDDAVIRLSGGNTDVTLDFAGHNLSLVNGGVGSGVGVKLTIIDSVGGGKFTSTLNALIQIALEAQIKHGTYELVIKGGNWPVNPDHFEYLGDVYDFVPEGYHAKEEADGTWTILPVAE